MSEEEKLLASCADYQVNLDRLERENAALRADKERLDWMEKYGATPICSRAAIDAARKEAKP
jgi:hypothetical protein